MSGTFVIDREDGPHGNEGEMWDVPRHVFFRTVEMLIELVRDEEVAAVLYELRDGGYAWLALTYFTQEQAAGVVRTIREDLPAAVRAAYPPEDPQHVYINWAVGDLVSITDRWLAGTMVSASVRFERDGETAQAWWDATVAELYWVRDALARHVGEDLAAKLTALPLRGPEWLSFKDFSEDEVSELLHALREGVTADAPDEGRERIAELVRAAAKWEAARPGPVYGKRPDGPAPEARPESDPSPGARPESDLGLGSRPEDDLPRRRSRLQRLMSLGGLFQRER
ncbi:hypothetical protein JNUCC0626_45680 [Lentzea sp. JNUCC 0626]|uniref:hypothetical protein n=1 Tax=Lentzea sp. JNUCC 0626 TaxID=3367513 RepID=UPI00374A6D75